MYVAGLFYKFLQRISCKSEGKKESLHRCVIFTFLVLQPLISYTLMEFTPLWSSYGLSHIKTCEIMSLAFSLLPLTLKFMLRVFLIKITCRCPFHFSRAETVLAITFHRGSTAPAHAATTCCISFSWTRENFQDCPLDSSGTDWLQEICSIFFLFLTNASSHAAQCGCEMSL